MYNHVNEVRFLDLLARLIVCYSHHVSGTTHVGGSGFFKVEGTGVRGDIPGSGIIRDACGRRESELLLIFVCENHWVVSEGVGNTTMVLVTKWHRPLRCTERDSGTWSAVHWGNQGCRIDPRPVTVKLVTRQVQL